MLGTAALAVVFAQQLASGEPSPIPVEPLGFTLQAQPTSAPIATAPLGVTLVALPTSAPITTAPLGVTLERKSQ